MSDVAPIELVLASASPRRAEFLRQLDVRFRSEAANLDESQINQEAASDYVRRIALEKAETIGVAISRNLPVLGADTAVVIDKTILGKPQSREHAKELLQRLSGRWHVVYTGVALVQRTVTMFGVRTRVKFRPLADEEIDAYWASGEARDKAGAYAIQGLGGAFVERIEGSYSNVVGLPLVETIAALMKHGVSTRLSRTPDST